MRFIDLEYLMNLIIMKGFYFVLFLSILGLSCDSTLDEVQKDRAKFIEIGLEESEPVNLNSLEYLNGHILFTSRDKKLKYLNVDQIDRVFKADPKYNEHIDSIVIFTKGQYSILFDFTKKERTRDKLNELSKLRGFKQIDSRLYLGKK